MRTSLFLITMCLFCIAYGAENIGVDISKTEKGEFTYDGLYLRNRKDSFSKFPGFSNKVHQIVYLDDDSQGMAGARHFFVKFADWNSLKTVQAISFDNSKLSSAKEIGKINTLNNQLKGSQFKRLNFIGSSSSEGSDVASGKAFNMDYQYSERNGTIQISDTGKKKIILEKQFRKLTNSCGSEASAPGYPNTVRAWATPEKDTFVFLVSNVGAQDSCLDPHAIEIFHVK